MSLLFLLHGANFGGAQLTAFEAMSLIAQETPVETWLPCEGSLCALLQEQRISYKTVPLPITYFSDHYTERLSLRSLIRLIQESARLWIRLRRSKPAVVVVNSSSLFLAAVAAKLAGCRVVSHVREVLPQESSRLRRFCTLRLLSFASDRVVVETDFVRTSLEDLVSGKKLVKVSNWFDSRRATPTGLAGRRALRERYAIQENDVVVLMLGALTIEKGVADLLQAAFILASTGQSYKFLLVGDTTLEVREEHSIDPRLTNLVAELKLQELVIFAGVQRDIAPFFAASDIAVSISRLPESFGRTIVEAMAFSVPVIATDIGPARELVQAQHDGILIPPADPRSLAVAIRKLADSPERSRAIVDAARKKVEDRFSFDVNVRKLLSLYQEVEKR